LTFLRGLQNLHPRFKSGRRLQKSVQIQWFVLQQHKPPLGDWTTVDYKP
jgi:hypothetical protein